MPESEQDAANKAGEQHNDEEREGEGDGLLPWDAELR
jgi:hypothetical protein